MAIINKYENDSGISLYDKMLGTDGDPGVNNGKTKNYSIASLAGFFATVAFQNLNLFIKGLSTSGAIYVSINPIFCEASDTTIITKENHFNVLTHSNTNGTHTIEIPSPEDGLIIRFKTDGTFSNQKDCTLVSKLGETIDGLSSYNLDRAYDGITLLGYNNLWFIIQKKDK